MEGEETGEGEAKGEAAGGSGGALWVTGVGSGGRGASPGKGGDWRGALEWGEARVRVGRLVERGHRQSKLVAWM